MPVDLNRRKARNRAWYLANREKAKETRRKWRERNAEKDKADIAAYQKANKVRLAAASRRWVQNNPDKVKEIIVRYRTINREKILLQGRRWRQANKGKVNAKKIRRVASKLLATPSWADPQRISEIYARASRVGKCLGIALHVDHVVPLRSSRVCGLHCEANLQILPGLENQRKSNRVWPGMTEGI